MGNSTAAAAYGAVDEYLEKHLVGSDPVLDAALEDSRAELLELQQAIEGSAMFYHAVDSRRILLRDIVGLEFDDANGVTIFVAGADPNP